MYSKILVPLDGSRVAEQVLPYVRFLAARLQIPARLLGVVDPAAIAVSGLSHDPRYIGRLTEDGRRASESYLARLSKTFSENSVTCCVPEGFAAEEIIALTRSEPDSLLAMCTHGYSGVKRWVLGSVTEKVVRHCGDPVLVVRPQ